MINPGDVKQMHVQHRDITRSAKTPTKQDKPTWPFPCLSIIYKPSHKPKMGMRNDEDTESYSAKDLFMTLIKFWR